MEIKRSPYERHWSCLVYMRRHGTHICGPRTVCIVALGTVKLHDITHGPSSCCFGIKPHWGLPWMRNKLFGKLSLLVACWRVCGTCMFVRVTESPCKNNFSDHLPSVNEINCFSLWWQHGAITGELCLPQLLWKWVGSTNLQQYSEKWQDKKHGRWSKQSRMGARKNQLNLV